MNGAKILVIDDEEFIRRNLKQHLEKEGYEVSTSASGEEGLDIYKREIPEIVLLDINLPGKNGLEILKILRTLSNDVTVIMITAFGDIETAVAAIKSGAHDFVEKPFDLNRISVLIKKALETVSLKRDLVCLKEDQRKRYGFDTIIAQSANMREVVALAKRVAESGINTILLQGESGTGKNLIAKVIHYNSSRASGPYVEVTSTAIPETLLESELFGYEKGAFTDAKVSKRGLFESAHGGTLFLDEIGDSKPSTQAKLLRVIEERTFKRVGGLKDITMDVRITAATNRDLKKAIEEGAFREDLYYRLKVVPITIPPLRGRREDIIPLAMHFIQLYDREFKKHVLGISPEAEELLVDYPWYGNIRELKNVIERICLLEKAETICPEHIPVEIREYMPTPDREGERPKLPEEGLSLKDVGENMEKELILQALHATNNNQTKASRLLGISRDVLRYKMQKFGVLP